MLKSEPNLHDVKRQGVATTQWALSRGELAVWALVVLGVPALVLIFRVIGGEPQPSVEIRVAEQVASRVEKSGPSQVKLDLNRATIEDLKLLPGIGPKRARNIVDRREQKGPYRSLWELAEIRGISKRMIERLEPLVEVRADVIDP